MQSFATTAVAVSANVPFHCNDEGVDGYKVYVGGRWGKKIAHGQMLHKIFMDQNEVLDTVEKAILLFRSAGESGERLRIPSIASALRTRKKSF